MKCFNLNNETVKILGVHFSYNKNLEQDKIFSEHILKIESILIETETVSHETINFRRKNYSVQISSYF